VTASAAADDANLVRIPGYEVLHLRAGGTPFRSTAWFSPVIGVQNLFDRQYTPSVNVNATGGKYYEPAPGRVVTVGLTVGFGGT
jgi:iron complex outermembrane receptor protein